MGIESVAIYGAGEETAPHVRYADDAYVLRSDAALPYLDIDAVLAVAERASADAVHPGYGFLAENADFAQQVGERGLVFVGPSPKAIAAMGDKVAARRIAERAGVQPVPGTVEPIASVEEAIAIASEIGYPIAVKAVGGGGGRGFRVAQREADLDGAFRGSSGEAERYFANPNVYLERYLEQPRHIEVQVFGDMLGHVVALGERDCSVQRRHQKLVEESPSPAVNDELRLELMRATVALARSVDYTGAGTVEYLLDRDGEFYFLEMNTRIQVEHTVTEMVTGIDLVREQIRVAQGEPLSFEASDVTPCGWAIECRINAEDAGRGFAPVPARVTRYREPVGFGIRVDGAVETGDEIQAQYDSLIAKLVAWGRTRDEAISRMTRALGDFVIDGPPTTIPFHLNLLEHPAFLAGEATTTFLTEYPDVLPRASDADGGQNPAVAPADTLSLTVEVDGRRFETRVYGLPIQAPASTGMKRPSVAGGRRELVRAGGGDELVSPIQGTVIRVDAANGDLVQPGAIVCVVEAMKMENELVAHKAGTISGFALTPGAMVTVGQVIATITDD